MTLKYNLIVILTGIATTCFSQLSLINANINEFNITPNSLSQVTVSSVNQQGTAVIEAQIMNAANEVLLKVVSQPVTIQPGINVFGNHNLSFEQITYAGSPQGDFLKNMHRLPSGAFNYCVRITPLIGIEEGDEMCQSVDASADEQLYLVNPQDEEVVETPTPILMWLHTEPFNLLSQGEFFRLILVELSSDQKAADAVLSNTPILIENYLSKHQLQYPLDAQKLESGKHYAWQVQKISNGNILAATEAWEFSLADQVKPKDHMYVELKTKLDGSVYFVQNDRIFFRYDERYQSTALDIHIFSDSRKEYQPEVTNEQHKSEDTKTIGYNTYELDLKPYHLKKGYYTLEVFNEKKEKYLLKFYIE